MVAGANARLVDKMGNTAAENAVQEGFVHLSDAIDVYCGNAQNNVRLYQIWRQYAAKFNGLEHDASFTEVVDNV